MHFLTYVFIPEHDDVETAVATAMRPFGDEFTVRPWKRHLGPREIEAMARHYRLPTAATHKLAQHMKDWCRAEGGIDPKGLFARMTCNPEARFDWYEIGGRWRGKFTNNLALCRDLLRRKDLADLLPHDFLTPDGVWHAKARFVPCDFFDGHIVEKSQSMWLREFRRALTRQKDGVVVCVDRHQ
jgi:hypothetical protein